MSINHFSSDLPEPLWWSQSQQHPSMEPNPNSPSSSSNPQPISSFTSAALHHYHHHHHHQSWLSPSMLPNRNPTTLNFNLNDHEDDEELDDNTDILSRRQDPEHELDKEPMFEKSLTPSDVGKLNRLVIPKQHAEKHFPLGGDSGDKGMLLSFEDESGKCWRFRYSYWNSSQSYVLTKGWSRYVKEKKLDAGDVVLFERCPTASERLFIGWRRRGGVVQDGGGAAAAQNSGGGGEGWSRVLYSAHPYPTHHGHGPPVPYQPDSTHAGFVGENRSAAAGGNSKTLRLFGVNLECQLDEKSEPSTSDGSSLSSQGQTPHHFYSQPYSSNHHDHMDITFSRNVNQMRNRRG